MKRLAMKMQGMRAGLCALGLAALLLPLTALAEEAGGAPGASAAAAPYDGARFRQLLAQGDFDAAIDYLKRFDRISNAEGVAAAGEREQAIAEAHLMKAFLSEGASEACGGLLAAQILRRRLAPASPCHRRAFAEAVSWLDRAIAVAPDNYGLRMKKLMALVDLGDGAKFSREALALLEDLWATKRAGWPEMPAAVEILTQLHVDAFMGAAVEGEKRALLQGLDALTQRGIELAPGDLRPHLGRLDYLLFSGDPAQAIEAGLEIDRRLSNRGEELRPLWMRLACAAHLLGRQQEALAHCLKADPNPREARTSGAGEAGAAMGGMPQARAAPEAQRCMDFTRRKAEAVRGHWLSSAQGKAQKSQ